MPYSNKHFQISTNLGTTQSQTPGSPIVPWSVSLRIRLSLYSSVSGLRDTTQSRTQGSSVINSQYQSGQDSVCILRHLSYKIQLNLELKVPQYIVNINPDMTQSVFSGICHTRYNLIQNSRFLSNKQSISIRI